MLAEPEPGRFAADAVEPVMLRREVPGSLRDYVLFRADPLMRGPTATLRQGIVDGGVPFAQHWGRSIWVHLRADPEQARIFDAGMSVMAAQYGPRVAAAMPLTSARRVMDVGGGHGRLLAAILGVHPRLDGILFDQPQVVAGASAFLLDAGVADRVEVVGGDFFAALPQGADAIVLSRILHDWDDADAARILARCREALPRGGTVLIVEYVIDDGPRGVAAKMLDLHMLLIFGGARERREAEYAALLSATGFRLDRVAWPEFAPNVVVATAV